MNKSHNNCKRIFNNNKCSLINNKTNKFRYSQTALNTLFCPPSLASQAIVDVECSDKSLLYGMFQVFAHVQRYKR